ncbi:MAG: hypothetical protein BWZ02_03253 [Lentisphaerae bacterium ADurb.BinA184]|nr:MAG: hypothetical protein BWZ02_03253 [Lentisphaerae bacterium ADurb.BinA184]
MYSLTAPISHCAESAYRMGSIGCQPRRAKPSAYWCAQALRNVERARDESWARMPCACWTMSRNPLYPHRQCTLPKAICCLIQRLNFGPIAASGTRSCTFANTRSRSRCIAVKRSSRPRLPPRYLRRIRPMNAGRSQAPTRKRVSAAALPATLTLTCRLPVGV